MASLFDIRYEDGKIVFISLSDNFVIRSFETSQSAYGKIKSARITLVLHSTGQQYLVEGSSLESLLNKANSLALKVINEELQTLSEQEAILQTKVAQEKIEAFNSFLTRILKKGRLKVELKDLIKEAVFNKEMPIRPSKPDFQNLPDSPKKQEFEPKFNFITRLISSMRKKAIEESEIKYNSALKDYHALVQKTAQKNRELESEYQESLNRWGEEIKHWENEKSRYLSLVNAHNSKVKHFSQINSDSSDEIVQDYFNAILNQSEIKSFIPEDGVHFRDGMLVIDSDYPHIKEMPSEHSHKWVKSKREIEVKKLKDVEKEKIYRNFISGVAIYFIHFSLLNDTFNRIKSVTFNGFIKEKNIRNGQDSNYCILTIQVDKEEFEKINLHFVDAFECFKGLKGIHSSIFTNVVPIRPILSFSKNDERFIESKDVLTSINEDTNIAALDWQDFEHLVRDIFEKEFSSNDTEVKVTQSSRDKGVDAIAFDPDPVKGGKIVIQAKKYTNVVGVNHVRDLYGTVINEGANRGILITTSTFGGESYSFAKDNPISLITGQELLFILKKHGINARIDLDEAKALDNLRKTNGS